MPWKPKGEHTVIAKLRVGRERCVRFYYVNGGLLGLELVCGNAWHEDMSDSLDLVITCAF